MKNGFLSLLPVPSRSKHEVMVKYFGRVSEFLVMTSERVAMPNELYTLGQVLGNLRGRGNRWAYELDDSRIMCAVNGKAAMLSDVIEAGAELCLFSQKSVFEL
jgi:molybdopterin converting factor small subunit